MPEARSTRNKFVPLDSEMLVAVRYNEQTRHLDVIFRTGEKYRYLDVPPLEHVGLMNAKSKGQYMHRRILGDRYKYERLD
ncbi:MAG TPA: KTSC domain-containing protein [Pyrinomonadaceae bacterium]|nr:KTSC domain-containing protein [Pyrinomonadaceae bacterium]